MTEDMVNHPSHYTSDPSGVECIEITRHRNFNVGNAIKYLWRAGLKKDEGLGSHKKHIEDLKKTVFYVNDEIKRLEALEAKRLEKSVPVGVGSIRLGQITADHVVARRLELERLEEDPDHPGFVRLRPVPPNLATGGSITIPGDVIVPPGDRTYVCEDCDEPKQPWYKRLARGFADFFVDTARALRDSFR